MAALSDTNAHQLQAVDAVMLTPLVRKALRRQSVTVVNWTYQPVAGGAAGGMLDTFIYRFSGQGDDQGVPVSWSVILKVLRAREGEHPDDPKYWKREAELYRSGLLDDLPGGFCAPRSFAVVEYPGEACWIWLEELHDVIGQQWPLEHYGIVARHLGQFNAAYLVERPLPSEAWLSSGWFRKIVQQVAPNVPQVQNAFTAPPIKRVFPGDASDQYSRLWSDRELFLNALDQLPQTFCHLDAFRRNLVAQRDADRPYHTAAIDWAFAGIGAVGAEIALPIVIGLAFFEIDAHDAAEADTIIFDGYLNGLREAGWQGESDTVRLGYTAAVAAKTFETLSFLPESLDEQVTPMLEQFFGRSLQDQLNQQAQAFRFVSRLADEARRLMSLLD